MTTRRSWIKSAIAKPVMAIFVCGSLIILAGVIAFAGYGFLFAAASPNERALAQAVYAQDLGQVAALLASGAKPTVWVPTNVEIGGGNACKAALAAVDMGSEVSLAILAQVFRHGCDPDESFAFPSGGGGGDSGGSGQSQSTLELAASCCLDAVETVLAAGATPGGRAGAGAMTVAIETRRRDTVAIVRRLIEVGADVNARDRRGRRPLAVAVGERNREVVELLERRGATEW
jgi:hypothetical protein